MDASAVLTRPPALDTLALLRVVEVAAILGLTDEGVRGHVRAGHIQAYRLGDGPKAHIRIPRGAVEDFLRPAIANHH